MNDLCDISIKFQNLVTLKMIDDNAKVYTHQFRIFSRLPDLPR